MKRTILFLSILLSCCSQTVFAYHFSAVAPSGQTLYYYTNGGKAIVTFPNIASNPWGGYSAPVGDLVIPDSVNFGGQTYPVTSINQYAFKQCTGLTSVTIPNTVTSIKFNAFCQCTDLVSVTIPNSVTSIEHDAFWQCTGLTTVTIPDSLTTIKQSTFSGCTGLTTVTIPNSVLYIEDYAFKQCTGLTSVTIGNSVTVIGENVFMGCTGLISVTIPDSVDYIGGDAFYGCTGLTSVTIGASVTQIGSGAFGQCTSLISITFLRPTPPVIYSGFSSTFSGRPSTCVVYIPCGSWSQYSPVITGSSLHEMYHELFAMSADDSSGAVVILTEPTCHNHDAVISAVPTDGHRFDHWSTGSTDNPYTLTVTSDTTVTAYFEEYIPEMYSVTVLVDNPAMGSVIGGGVYEDGTLVTITAYPADGYHFDHWSTGSIVNPYTLTVTNDTTITAFFVEDLPETYSVTILVDNPATGSVTGGGVYEDGTSVTITAYPADGYRFDHWSTGSTDNPYTLTVTSDTTITAYFVSNGGTEGIGEIREDDIRISVLDGCIFVEGIPNEEVRVYDITGRMVQNRSLPSGVYIVKIGTLPAQKVVVMR